jgi:lipopolysaccharide/colanic/teichoic acid biosynthesis glycosyltransferase
MPKRITAIQTQLNEPIHYRRRTNFNLNNAVKRLLDILASAFGLLLFGPLFLFLAWRIKRDSPGPVFYRGPRLGRGGRIFQILKFRTMYEQSQSYAGPRVTAQDDPRITPLGKWLRYTKLNELPQLWNVLVGEMSLVGPRPEDPELGMAWPAEVRREVLSVRPGITSPASVQFHNEEDLLANKQVISTYMEDIVPFKLRLDQLYVRHHSLWLDLDTLFWTFMVLVPKLGGKYFSGGIAEARQLHREPVCNDNFDRKRQPENEHDPLP